MASPETNTDDLPESEGEAQEEKKEPLSLVVKVDNPSACERHVVVTVAREDIDRYFSQEFDELMPEVEVPGFRKGRAPRKLVESKFKHQVNDKVKGSLLMDSIAQVSDEENFSAISEPDFDFDSIKIPDEGPLTYEFKLEVRPEFDLPKWKGLNIEKPAKKIRQERCRPASQESAQPARGSGPLRWRR